MFSFLSQDVEQIEFDVLAEHRNWCPWVTPVPSLNANNPAEVVKKYPGWQILLHSLIQCSSSGRPSGQVGDVQQVCF